MMIAVLSGRGAGVMDQAEPIVGFYAPAHRALIEPILLGGGWVAP